MRATNRPLVLGELWTPFPTPWLVLALALCKDHTSPRMCTEWFVLGRKPTCLESYLVGSGYL